MHLINTHTLYLEMHRGVPQYPHMTKVEYAILSHRWEDQEVSYTEYCSLTSPHVSPDVKAAIRQKSGYVKIVKACKRARIEGLEYIWIDTCCIDKSSSAELSEAINSMAKWYSDSEVCFAYLSDIHPSTPGEPIHGAKAVARSKWFQRGWTLQELIFPSRLHFFDASWGYLGSKNDLTDGLSIETKIDRTVLQDHKNLGNICIARKMSWTCRRETTRAEDQSYCLLGLFGVHMPLLYGEGGGNAFARLQEAIIRAGCDQSILIWYYEARPIERVMFAPGVFNYPNAANLIALSGALAENLELLPSGIRLTAPVIEEERYLLALLKCADEDDPQGPIAMRLQKPEGYVRGDGEGTPNLPIRVYRLWINRFATYPIVPSNVFPIVPLERLAEAEEKTLLIGGYGPDDDDILKRVERTSLWLRTTPEFSQNFTMKSVEGSGSWVDRTGIFHLLMTAQSVSSTFTWCSADGSTLMRLVVRYSRVEPKLELILPDKDSIPGDFGGIFEFAFDGDAPTVVSPNSDNEAAWSDDEDMSLQTPSSSTIEVSGLSSGHRIVLSIRIEWRMDALVCILDVSLRPSLQDRIDEKREDHQHRDLHIERTVRFDGLKLAYRPRVRLPLANFMPYYGRGSEFNTISDFQDALDELEAISADSEQALPADPV